MLRIANPFELKEPDKRQLCEWVSAFGTPQQVALRCRVVLAAAQGISKSAVNRIWQSHNLKPHRTKTFKLSRDAKFLERLTDVVGLYLNPPDKAIVLCVDEKSQIQALDRTQAGLPLKKGRCGTMTHDYKRNGTTTLLRRSREVTHLCSPEMTLAS
jgi:hypothetical protein